MDVIKWINKKYDIDEQHDSKIEIDVDVDLSKQVTVIAGGSGTGKTTLLRNLFNVEDVNFKITDDECIFQLLYDILKDEKEVSSLLFNVGLSSVPTWKNKYSQLSNGEKLRFEIAYKLCSDDEIIYIDEFTSMLDRQTAQNLCKNFNKLIEKYNKRVVLATAHFDILDWINIDQMVDVNLKKCLVLPQKTLLTLMKWRLEVLKESGGTYLSTITI